MATAPLGAQIAEFICKLDGRAMDPKLVHALKQTVMDCLAAILAGTTEPVSLKMVAHVADGANQPNTIIGHTTRTTPLGAALANGTMAHACDYDDTSETMCGHPTAPMLPAVLAAAEMRSRSGLDVLAAVAAGLEVATKLGKVSGYEQYHAGWHATATLGVLGAAAGAARALGLDRAGVATALGIAASRVSGLRANIGTMTKPLHVGFAAHNGLEAALLAEAGVTASATALDGPFGFLKVYAPKGGTPAGVAESLGNPFDVLSPGIAYKLYPSCWDTHGTIDGTLSLKSAYGLTPKDIRKVRSGLPPGIGGDLPHHNPTTPLEAKFSMEFCVACALVKGRVTLKEFVPEVVNDPDVRALISKVEVATLPELSEGDGPRFTGPSSVEIETTDGRHLRTIVRRMKGHPENPFSQSDFESKFRACGERALDSRRIENAIGLINALDRLANIRELMDAMTPSRH